MNQSNALCPRKQIHLSPCHLVRTQRGAGPTGNFWSTHFQCMDTKSLCIKLVAREEEKSQRNNVDNILNKASHAHHGAEWRDLIIIVNKEWWTLYLTDFVLRWNHQQWSLSYCWFCFTIKHISKNYNWYFILFWFFFARKQIYKG